MALVGRYKRLLFAPLEFFPAVCDLLARQIGLAVLSETLISVIVRYAVHLHLLCGGVEELRILFIDPVKKDTETVPLEMAYLDGSLVVCSFQYLDTFRCQIFVQFPLHSLGEGDVLYGRGILVFQACISDVELLKSGGFCQNGDKFPGAHVGLLDLENEKVPCTAKIVERVFLDKKRSMACLKSNVSGVWS